MAQNDVFYRRATSGNGEIADLDIIQTKRIKESCNLHDYRWYKSRVAKGASYLDIISAKQRHFRFRRHFR